MVSPIRIRVPPLTKALQITRKIGDMRKSLSLSPVHRLGGRTTVASGYERVPQHLREDLGSGVAGEEQGSTRVSEVRIRITGSPVRSNMDLRERLREFEGLMIIIASLAKMNLARW